MRVFHVAESVLGGCGTYLNEIVPMQIAELGEKNVLVLAPHQHLRHLKAISHGVLCDFERTSRKNGLLHFFIAAGRGIRRFRPDVIHAHSSFAGLAVRLLCLFTWRRPVVIYCPHGWAFEFSAARWMFVLVSWSERLLAPLCDCIIAISNSERLQGEGVGISAEKFVVIHNGIAAQAPTLETALWDDSRRKVLFVGRLDRQKGLDVLLAAVSGMQDQLSVRIVGAAVVAEGRESQADTAMPHVVFLGWQTQAEVGMLVNACDLMVIPSRWEAFGLVAIEAMRAGKPVVASRVGGLVEIVVDGLTGRLVPAENAIALRDALLQDSNDDLVRMGGAGRASFERSFTIDRVHNALMDLYSHWLSIRRPHAVLQAAAQPIGLAE